jgi:hypothetical protein
MDLFAYRLSALPQLKHRLHALTLRHSIHTATAHAHDLLDKLNSIAQNLLAFSASGSGFDAVAALCRDLWTNSAVTTVTAAVHSISEELAALHTIAAALFHSTELECITPPVPAPFASAAYLPLQLFTHAAEHEKVLLQSSLAGVQQSILATLRTWPGVDATMDIIAAAQVVTQHARTKAVALTSKSFPYAGNKATTGTGSRR